jgi:hypothetical protein
LFGGFRLRKDKTSASGKTGRFRLIFLPLIGVNSFYLVFKFMFLTFNYP